MREIPPEILISITSHIKLQDKLQCVRVCNKWNNIISNSNLFENLCLKGESKLLAALVHFESQPHLFDLVKTLRLSCTNGGSGYSITVNSTQLGAIPTLFSQVIDANISFRGYTILDWQGSWSKLKKLKDSTSNKLTKAIITTPHHYLQHLEINFKDKSMWEGFQYDLKNAPILAELHLRGLKYLYVRDLEMKHEVISNLQVLTIYPLKAKNDFNGYE